MDIKVGEYVRTPYNTIEKIERIDNAEKNIYEDIVITDRSAYSMSWLRIHNAKYSFDITDLLKVGDYVNGEVLTQVRYDLFINNDFSKKQYAKHIKSIVTKEQFESMSYKVGD